MPIGEICTRDVVIVRRDDSVLQAARLMRTYHVGDVLVVDERDGVRVPVGIITDRDLVVEIMAMELAPAVMTVGDIMAPELGAVNESCGLFEAIQYMRGKAIRRLVVLNDTNGSLAGIVTLDDLLGVLGEELAGLAHLVERERDREAKTRRGPGT